MTTSAISSATDASAFLTTSSVTGSIATAAMARPGSRCCRARRAWPGSPAGRRRSRRTPRRSAAPRAPARRERRGGRPACRASPARARSRRGASRASSARLERGERVARRSTFPPPERSAHVHDVDRRVRRRVAVGPLVLGVEARREPGEVGTRRPARAPSARTPARRSACRRRGTDDRRPPSREGALGLRLELAVSRARAPRARRLAAQRQRPRDSCSMSEKSRPTALKTPGAGGTITRRMWSARAISTATTGPLPPKPQSTKSRGSRPR